MYDICLLPLDDILAKRRHARLRGLFRAVVMWLSSARRRAAEHTFHPHALDFGLAADDATAPRPRKKTKHSDRAARSSA